jgi:hypothetical protein
MAQVDAWLLRGDVQRLVIIVSGVDSGETLERWQFNVSLEVPDGENKTPNGAKPVAQKTIKEIHGEIQAIIRQVTASVTFLPLLNEPCSFDLLVYTKKDAVVPAKWEDSDPCYIANSQEVKLRSFTTSVCQTLRIQNIIGKLLYRFQTNLLGYLLANRFTRSILWLPTEKPTSGSFEQELALNKNALDQCGSHHDARPVWIPS